MRAQPQTRKGVGEPQSVATGRRQRGPRECGTRERETAACAWVAGPCAAWPRGHVNPKRGPRGRVAPGRGRGHVAAGRVAAGRVAALPCGRGPRVNNTIM